MNFRESKTLRFIKEYPRITAVFLAIVIILLAVLPGSLGRKALIVLRSAVLALIFVFMGLYLKRKHKNEGS